MKLIKPILSLILCATVFLNANAGNGNKKNNNQTKKPTTTSGRVPIDGGIGLLLAAGVGIGVKKILANKNKKALHTEL